MIKRKEIVISAEKVNRAVKEFTATPREFTAYSADRIEAMAHWYGLIPYGARYNRFDPHAGTIIFVTQELEIDMSTAPYVEGMEYFIENMGEQRKIPEKSSATSPPTDVRDVGRSDSTDSSQE